MPSRQGPLPTQFPRKQPLLQAYSEVSSQFPPLGEPSAAARPPPEEGDLGSRQLLPVSGISWVNRDVTKPALHSCTPPKKGSGSLSAGEWAGDQHIPTGNTHTTGCHSLVSPWCSSGEENRAWGGWSVEIPPKNNVTCDHPVSCSATRTRPVFPGLGQNAFSNTRILDLFVVWPTI